MKLERLRRLYIGMIGVTVVWVITQIRFNLVPHHVFGLVLIIMSVPTLMIGLKTLKVVRRSPGYTQDNYRYLTMVNWLTVIIIWVGFINLLHT